MTKIHCLRCKKYTENKFITEQEVKGLVCSLRLKVRSSKVPILGDILLYS